MTGRPAKEAWLKFSQRDRFVEGTWYIYKIKPSISISVQGDDMNMTADHVAVLVVKAFDSDQFNTVAYMAYPNGMVMNWAPLCMLAGSNHIQAMTVDLGYYLSSRKEQNKNGVCAS